MQKVSQKDEQGDLCLIVKFDAANLEQKHSSHGVVWGGARLSPGIRVLRTRLLEMFGLKRINVHGASFANAPWRLKVFVLWHG